MKTSILPFFDLRNPFLKLNINKMRISTQNLQLKIFFEIFLYLAFETIFWHVRKKLPKKIFFSFNKANMVL